MPKVPNNYSVLCDCGERAVLKSEQAGNYHCNKCGNFIFSYFYSVEKAKYVFNKEKMANLKNFHI